MATERNVVDFKIHNLTEEQFQELKAQGKIDPNAVYCTPDTTKERLDALETKTTSLEENKQDIATAVNYDNIANCITEIPQDIKLGLSTDSSGVSNLIIKAGSKLYYPNGSGVFDEVVLTDDKTYTDTTKTGQWLVCLTKGLTGVSGSVANSVSGTTKPTAGFSLWYNTEENIMYRYGSITSDPTSNVSLPIAIVTLNNTGVASIDQVFNGFGYVGSTVFVLPGVKGLAPDGRNEDGTLKNKTITTTKVIAYTRTVNGGKFVGCITGGAAIDSGLVNYIESETQPTANYAVWYKPSENKIYYVINGVATATTRFVAWKETRNTSAPYNVTSFEPKTTFHAADYSNFEKLSDTVETLSETVVTNNGNAVHKTGAETIADPKTFTSEIKVQGSANAYRIVGASYGSFWRQDEKNLYLMLTDAGNPTGGWNNLRPFNLDLATGAIRTTNPSSSSNDTQIATTAWCRSTTSMPSDSYTSLTLGATGATYTAPADGWYCISKASTGSGQYLTMSNVTAGVGFTNSQASGGYVHGFVPVKKGDTLKITYTVNGTLSFFRFTYAEGAKHLA